MHSLHAPTLEILRTLIAFDTTSRDSNLALIEWVETYLKTYGINATRIPSADGKKSNLFASIGGNSGGIVLSGHTDVVPVDGQPWDTNPFELIQKENRYYGRGTSDMKSFLACCLSLVPSWTSKPPKHSVHLAFSYDEEIGCLGVPYLISHLKQSNIKPELVVIGEPTDMKLVNGHKGVASYETTFIGLEGHSSDPDRGINAISYGMKFIAFLESLAEEYKSKADAACSFHPKHTTIHVGVIKGGTARNIIPRECKINWEIRAVKEEDLLAIERAVKNYLTDVLQSMKSLHKDSGASQMTASRNPALMPGISFPLQSEVMAALGTNQTQTISFYTEGGLFQNASIPAIVVGPGSIKQAHAPNEFIESTQIDICLDFLEKLTLGA
jgi:acetylornithine deacetylase